MDFLEKLNAQQKEAVLYNDGPLLVLAGAGTGKTTVIAYKVAQLLRTGWCRPSEILAVTFTNKSAREMQNRVYSLTGIKIEFFGTFHSICFRILKTHAEELGLPKELSVIDYSDQIKLIKNIYKDYNLNIEKLDPYDAHSIISSLKDSSLDENAIPEQQQNVSFVYQHYQRRLQQSSLVDFGDIIMYVNKLFQIAPHVKESYRNRFSYVLVDEYQDTNSAQYEWIKHIAGKHICCVGDDDQSIYAWRGAQISNILGFPKDFPNTHVVALSTNYRSSQDILDVAYSIIKHNENRYEKRLSSSADKVHARPKLVECMSPYNEAEFIAQTVQKISPEFSSAILVRTNFQMRIIEEILLKSGVNYVVVGSNKFYDLREIKDAIAYIKASLNPADDISFEKIINTPRRGVGAKLLEKIKAKAIADNISLHDSTKLLVLAGDVPRKTSGNLQELVGGLARWKEYFGQESADSALQKVLDESGLTQKTSQTQEEADRQENLQELVRSIRDYSSIESFLERTTAMSPEEDLESQEVQNLPQLMTIHSAKGLEFDAVFLPNWNQGVFPSERSMPHNLEEERRIAYVAVTRCKKELFISYSRFARSRDGTYGPLDKSEFVENLDLSTIERDSYPKSRNHFALLPGMKISHRIFGSGLIIRSIDSNKYEVAFKHNGIKLLHKDFIRPDAT